MNILWHYTLQEVLKMLKKTLNYKEIFSGKV
jgi:hypothetical protein